MGEVIVRPSSPVTSQHSSPFRALADGTRRRILESLRERERSVQYPRVQPPVSPNATPSTTTNSNGAIVVTPRAN